MRSLPIDVLQSMSEVDLSILEKAVQDFRYLRGGSDLNYEERKNVFELACKLWEACIISNEKTPSGMHIMERLDSLARDLFDFLQGIEGHTLDFLYNVSEALLQFGRKWIMTGQIDRAEYFISAARLLHTLCFDRVNQEEPSRDPFEERPSETKVIELHADILLSSLQLAIVAKHKAPHANLLLLLKALSRGASTPISVGVKIAAALASIHLDAALNSIDKKGDVDGIRLLQQAMEVVEEQLQRLKVAAKADSDKICLSDCRLQLLRMLLSSHQRLGNHTAVVCLASTYLADVGFCLYSESVMTDQPKTEKMTTAAEQPDQVINQAQCQEICWDIFFLSASSKVALQQYVVVLLDLNQALNLGCKCDVAKAVLSCLLCNSQQVQKLDSEALSNVVFAVRSCVEKFKDASSELIMMVLEALIGADQIPSLEGSSVPNGLISKPEGFTTEGEKISVFLTCALEMLVDDTVFDSMGSVSLRAFTLLHAYGGAHFRDGRYDTARAIFLAALRYARGPRQYPAAARLLAICLSKLGHHESALTYVDHAESQDPGSSACHLLRLKLLMCKPCSGNADIPSVAHSQELLSELDKLLLSSSFEATQLEVVVNEAIALGHPYFACKALKILKETCWKHTGSAGLLDPLTPSRHWLEAWLLQEPKKKGVGKVGIKNPCLEGAVTDQTTEHFPTSCGTDLTFHNWIEAAVVEIDWICDQLQSDLLRHPLNLEDNKRIELLQWTTNTVLKLAQDAMQAHLWKTCISVLRRGSDVLKTSQISTQQQYYTKQEISEVPHYFSLHSALLPSACLLSYALIQAYREEEAKAALSHKSFKDMQNIPNQKLISLLNDSEASLTMAQEIHDRLVSESDHSKEMVCSFTLPLASLNFQVSTFARNEGQQKRALQVLLGCPGVSDSDLELLAALCLEEKPWKNVGLGCACLGFALRLSLASTHPDFIIVSKAIRTLYQLSTSFEVKAKVCEKALNILQADRATFAQVREASNGTCNPNTLYPEAEVRWLWTACFNDAVLSSHRERETEASHYLDLATSLLELSQPPPPFNITSAEDDEKHCLPLNFSSVDDGLQNGESSGHLHLKQNSVITPAMLRQSFTFFTKSASMNPLAASNDISVLQKMSNSHNTDVVEDSQDMIEGKFTIRDDGEKPECGSSISTAHASQQC